MTGSAKEFVVRTRIRVAGIVLSGDHITEKSTSDPESILPTCILQDIFPILQLDESIKCKGSRDLLDDGRELFTVRENNPVL